MIHYNKLVRWTHNERRWVCSFTVFPTSDEFEEDISHPLGSISTIYTTISKTNCLKGNRPLTTSMVRGGRERDGEEVEWDTVSEDDSVSASGEHEKLGQHDPN